MVAYLTAKSVRPLLDLPDLVPVREKLKISCEQQTIPNCDAMEKVIRCETAAEKSLSRALDRLERLQRRRKGEAVPPRLSLTID